MTLASCHKDLVERFIGYWNLGKRAIGTGHWASADGPEQSSKVILAAAIDSLAKLNIEDSPEKSNKNGARRILWAEDGNDVRLF
jgi:hypothetical protein